METNVRLKTHLEMIARESAKVIATLDPVIGNMIALELAKLQVPAGELNNFNTEERTVSSPSSATNVKTFNIPSEEIEETVEEPEALNNLDISEVSSIVDDDVSRNTDSFYECNEEISQSLESLVTTVEEQPLVFPNSLQQTTINFYLKNSEGYCKNVNIQVEKCFSKTEKELFKVLQAAETEGDSHNTDDCIISAEENVS